MNDLVSRLKLTIVFGLSINLDADLYSYMNTRKTLSCHTLSYAVARCLLFLSLREATSIPAIIAQLPTDIARQKTAAVG